MEDFYTVRQIQEILKVDRITIYRMLSDGRLKGIKIGQQWRFPRSEIERFLGGDVPTADLSSTTTLTSGDTSFPTHCIQTIQDLYAEISQTGAMVVDLSGNPLTIFSRPNKFCSLIMTSSSGQKACQTCWAESANRCGHETHFTCHAGLQYLAVPLLDRGAQIGAFLTGQFYWQPPDRYEEADRIRKLAGLHRIDADTLQNAAFEVQVIPSDKRIQVEGWPRHAADSMHSILNERAGFIQRLQQISDLTQVH